MTDLSVARPAWFNKLDRSKEVDRLLAHKYFVQQAALFATPDATVRGLADTIGVSETGLRLTYHAGPNRGVISPRLASLLQGVVGKEFLPMSLLRPDMFWP